jgi:GntR family transcriptional regulator
MAGVNQTPYPDDLGCKAHWGDWYLWEEWVVAQQPMYQQIAEALQKAIELGATLEPGEDKPDALRPGAKLPTELELCETYGASRNTIRDAIKRLTSQGMVETRPGQGTYVTARIDPFVTELFGDPEALGGAEGATYLSDVRKSGHRKASFSSPKVEIQIPTLEVSRRLRLAPASQVVSRHQMRYIDNIPWSLQTSFYPMDFVTKGNATRLLMAEDIAEGTVRYLADTIGIRQVGYRDWVTARGPDANEQAFFTVSHDASVFEIFRTAFDETGTPLRVTVTVFPADRNQFTISVGRVPPPEYYQANPADPQEPASAQA